MNLPANISKARLTLLSLIGIFCIAAIAGATKYLYPKVEYHAKTYLLKSRIEAEYPKVADPSVSDFEKVSLLRNWAYKNTDFSTRSMLLDADPEFNFYGRHTYDLFSAYEADEGGVWCGGAAYTLMRLLKKYGYETYTADYGDAEAMTHVTTLVKINHNGKEIVSVQDPTFNVTYINSDGEPYDYIDLLKTIRDGRHDEVRIKEGESIYRDYLVHDDNLPFDNPQYLDSVEPLSVLDSSVKKYEASVTLDRFFERHEEQFTSFLMSEGLSVSLLSFMLYPINIGDDEGPSEILDAAKGVITPPGNPA